MGESRAHTFHIPVMGIGYTIDTPLKVAHLGISSVVSLVDDILIEKMREFYSTKFGKSFQAISNKNHDYRAERIRQYLNLLDELVNEKFEQMKQNFREKSDELNAYFELLPDTSTLKREFREILNQKPSWQKLHTWLREHLCPGSIDVNIMTKVDGPKFVKGEQLPVEFNEAHAALRGFAESNLSASVVLSAGMNPKLYGYMEQFADFFPDANGELRKKIILKVSDYRSALIQGKFLAKKGLWVSEFRIESGLNCGGHAFATDGFLLGPILQEFKDKRHELLNELLPIYGTALEKKGYMIPKAEPIIKITAQGGVGTSEEHTFLLDHYKLDSIGWGTPFLNVPEAVNVDDETQQILISATEADLYLSDISPLDVPFNTVRGNSKERERQRWVEEGHPGAPCSHKHVELNTDLTDQPICKASRQYQTAKIKELNSLNLSFEDYQKRYKKIVDKTCICVGLGTSALMVNDLDTRIEGPTVSVCPGPNMAYFSQIVSLRRMVDHIYGRDNIIERQDRPHFFIKELSLYVDYLKSKLAELSSEYTDKQAQYLTVFRANLNSGIQYYKTLFEETAHYFSKAKEDLLNELSVMEQKLAAL